MSKITRNKYQAKFDNFLGMLNIDRKSKKGKAVISEEPQPGPSQNHAEENQQPKALVHQLAEDVETTDIPTYRQEAFKINHATAEGAKKVANMASLQYEPLRKDRNEFRILTILSDDDGSNIVRCTMETCSLDDPPPFYALSYVWGDPTSTADIIVNESAFSATVNLEQALRAMWKRLDGKSDYIFTTPNMEYDEPLFPTKSKMVIHLSPELRFSQSKPLRIWADAVCINQADIEERNDQVLRMRHIYSKATATIGWLGPADQTSNDAFYMLHLLARKSPADKYNEIIHKDGNKYNEKFKHLWVAVAQILWREYWSRSWILQEILLGNQVWFVCGGASASFKIILLGLYGAQFQHEAALEQLGYSQDAGPLSPNIPSKLIKLCMKFEFAKWREEKDAWNKRQATKQLDRQAGLAEDTPENTSESKFGNGEYRLLNLLYEKSVSRLKSTHINDQVYSLLGLASDAEELVPKPNYNTPFRTIMTEIYEAIIKKTQMLDWICFSGGNDSFDPKGRMALKPASDLAEDKGKNPLEFKGITNHYEDIQFERAVGLWPSWVPDHQKPCGGLLSGIAQAGVQTFCHATKSHDPEIRINGSILSCRGIIFDTIDNPTSETREADSTSTKGKSPETANPYITAAATYEAIWQSATLQAHLKGMNNGNPVDMAWAFAEYWNGIFQGSPDDREQLYPPLSSFDAKSLDPTSCARRWGLLHHQADLLVHGLPLREWVKRRTWDWSFSIQRFADDLEYEAGLEELMAPVRGQISDADEKPRLLTLTKLQNFGGLGEIIARHRNGIASNITAVNTSVELYVTRKGYIGSRYKYYTKGAREDVVALLFGCSVPVILRPREFDDGYDHVGETYVHGIMNGEAFDDPGIGDVQWINIH